MLFQSLCLPISPPITTPSYLSRSHHHPPKLKTLSHVSIPRLKNGLSGISFPSLNRCRVSCAASSSGEGSSKNEVEPFNGKAGCVSFYGLSHQSIEEAKLVSAPFNEDQASLFWLLGPIALIASLIVPQFFIGSIIEGFFRNEVLLEMIVSLTFEVFFYIGMAIFLTVTDKIQRPYLQFTAKRWGLITGLKGYMSLMFFTMGIKILAPIFAVIATWSFLGPPVVVAVIPFLLSCAAQLAFEHHLDKCGSSSWPLVPIIFEVYRLYQLTKATHFIEKLIFSMRGLPETAQLLQKGNAYVVMIFTFQMLGIACLWSLMTFLVRLFPSRPVAENY